MIKTKEQLLDEYKESGLSKKMYLQSYGNVINTIFSDAYNLHQRYMSICFDTKRTKKEKDIIRRMKDAKLKELVDMQQNYEMLKETKYE